VSHRLPRRSGSRPGGSLAHEWYTPYVLLVLIPGGLLAGVVMGTVAGSLRTGLSWKAIEGGIVGWLLAMAGGWMVFSGHEAGLLTLHGLLACAMTAGGFALGANLAGKPSGRGQSEEL
jgi:hypothetical protein